MNLKKEKAIPGNCVLIADDDIDDIYLIKQAFASLKTTREIRTVSNGAELMDYLFRRDSYENTEIPNPRLILLDLNMPKKDGRECLKEIKGHPKLKNIPVVVYSTSNNPDDISYSYAMGANSYVIKPYSYNELTEIMEMIERYWFTTVKTPYISL